MIRYPGTATAYMGIPAIRKCISQVLWNSCPKNHLDETHCTYYNYNVTFLVLPNYQIQTTSPNPNSSNYVSVCIQIMQGDDIVSEVKSMFMHLKMAFYNLFILLWRNSCVPNHSVTILFSFKSQCSGSLSGVMYPQWVFQRVI